MIHRKILFRVVAAAAAAVLAACAPMDMHRSMGMHASAAAYEMPAKKAADGTLTNAAGMTLYTFDKDAGGKSACNGPCAANWPPLAADGDDKASGEWSIITRADGSKQWAYADKPLYTWIKDRKPGDKTGEGMLGNTWHVAKE